MDEAVDELISMVEEDMRLLRWSSSLVLIYSESLRDGEDAAKVFRGFNGGLLTVQIGGATADLLATKTSTFRRMLDLSIQVR